MCQLKYSAYQVFLQDLDCHQPALAFSIHVRCVCTSPLCQLDVIVIGFSLRFYTASQSALALSGTGVYVPYPPGCGSGVYLKLAHWVFYQGLTSRVGALWFSAGQVGAYPC